MGSSGVGGGGGGARAGRLLRLLLLLVLALAAVEYLFGSILDASPLRTYLYTPASNNRKSNKRRYWFKKIPITSNTEIPFEETTNTSSPIRNISIDTIVTNVSINDNLNMSTTNIMAIERKTKNLVTMETTEKENKTDLPLCQDDVASNLGPITANTTYVKLKYVEKKYPEVNKGGRYSPPNCTARHRVAIIVPYRNRKHHLAIFLNHMHPFLMKQQIEYGIYIVEQSGYQYFNRAKLMNVGFVESQRITGRRYQCFIFHDIDLLPLDGRNMYSCPRQPRHMSASIDKFDYKLPYEELFGGVAAMTEEQFRKVNGLSNKYWGWGGEDDDLAARLKKMKYHIGRYKMSIARYTMLKHVPTPDYAANANRHNLLLRTKRVFRKEGLSSLTYKLLNVTQYHLYTHILANIEDESLWAYFYKPFLVGIL